MITRDEFAKIDEEVKNALEEAFSFLKEKKSNHNYVLYLADGEYVERYENNYLRLNPYTIDNKEDRYKDESRLNFFINLMSSLYSFPLPKTITNDNENTLTLEMMVYTHIWESKPFLKQLYRLACLINGKSYLDLWKVIVPEMNKHKFIREDIRDILRKRKMKLATVISKGFHTSLRNAFAHSEYSFNDHSKSIYLDTYKGASWDIEKITYDDWTKRFVYSALLSYHFLNIKSTKRKALTKDLGESEFLIIHPINKRKFSARKIYYDDKWDGFSFYKS